MVFRRPPPRRRRSQESNPYNDDNYNKQKVLPIRWCTFNLATESVVSNVVFQIVQIPPRKIVAAVNAFVKFVVLEVWF
jgi:hypothetical protein